MTQAMIDECVGLVIKHALVALPEDKAVALLCLESCRRRDAVAVKLS